MSSVEVGAVRAAASAETPPSLCWICKANKADSGEHKTKRSDLLAVLGKPSQQNPFFYHDMEKPNRAVGSLDAAILKNPIRICAHCNSARTQPHDRAWERMSDLLRSRRPPLKVGGFVRGNRIFPHSTRLEMRNVHLYFVKLFGCMVAEAQANGHDVPIDLGRFSKAIMSGRPHPEVHLQFGKCDGTVGRSNLHLFKTEQGSIWGGWLYELGSIAVSVLFLQEGKWERRRDVWHPLTGSNRLQIADFQYKKKAAAAGEEPA